MLKRIIIEHSKLILLIASLTIASQNVKSQYKAQYITPKITEKTRKIQINKYYTDYKFRDGMLAVQNEDTQNWGFINEQGEKVIDFVYYKLVFNNQTPPHFSDGVAWIYKYNKKASNNGETKLILCLLDKQGNEKEMPPFNQYSDFVDGVAFVVRGEKCYYIDKTGKEIYSNLSFKRQFGQTIITPRPFSNGLSVYYDYIKGKCGFINLQGDIQIPAKYSYAKDFKEGLAAVLFEATDTSASKWGYIDTSGSVIIPAIFNREPSSFSHGYAKVIKADGSVVLINRTSKIVSSELVNIYPFERGHAITQFKNEGHACVIDTNLKVIKELEYLGLKGFNSLSDIANLTVSVHRGGVKPWEQIHNNFETPFIFVSGIFFDSSENLSFPYYKDSEVTEGYTINMVTSNLMHCETQRNKRTIIDGFINHDGIYQFIFSPEEF